MKALRFVLSLPTVIGAALAYAGGVALFWANALLVDVTRAIRGR